MLASVSYRARNVINEQNNQISYCLFMGLRPLQRQAAKLGVSHPFSLGLSDAAGEVGDSLYLLWRCAVFTASQSISSQSCALAI